MRIFRQLNGFFARLLKTNYSGTASNTSFPAVWIFCNQTHNSLPGHLAVTQKNSFFTMPEMLDRKVDPDLYTPPPRVHGMTSLDRTAFKKDIVIPAIKINKDVVNKLLKVLKGLLLKRPGLKRVVDDPEDQDKKIVLLDPQIVSVDCSLGESEQQILKDLDVNSEIIKYHLELTYDHFKLEEILHAVLPEGQDVPSAFSRVGHIAHLNLRDHQLPYKHLIGQVIIDKHPGITCAVNKINFIENAYRNFQMEVIAGDKSNMVTKVKENYITYEFDFSKVYWNPRLSTEHARVIDLLKPGDLLFDVFAGVGPFAVPAAKKGCVVLANDLNPESYKWLQHNCKLNKVDRKVRAFNMDGRDFLAGPAKEELARQLSVKERKCSLHITMNLPAMAIEFLDVFRHLLEGDPGSTDLPIVHCYCFSKHDNPVQDVQERAEAYLGCSLEGLCTVEPVRNVAPNKEMMCISFSIPGKVLYRPPSLEGADNSQEPASKRLRPNDDSAEEKIESDDLRGF